MGKLIETSHNEATRKILDQKATPSQSERDMETIAKEPTLRSSLLR